MEKGTQTHAFNEASVAPLTERPVRLTLLQKGREWRGGGRGGEMRGWNKSEGVLHIRTNPPMRNVIITYCKHALITLKKKEKE